MLCLYDIGLLMNFTDKKTINLPFFLYINLGKMIDKVQENPNQLEHNLFHFSLIKLLVLEELKKTNGEWVSFLNATGLVKTPFISTSRPKKNTRSSSEKDVTRSSIMKS